MGMSSSQARLLTLTARMHDIEYKAQRIEAQKLQMANESRRVYEEYLDALDAKKIQYKGINSDGSITFRDASLRALENGAVPGLEGEFSYKPFLLKNGMTDEIYITPEFAEYYGINPDNMEPLGTLDEYLGRNGVEKVPEMRPHYVKDYNNVVSVNPVENEWAAEPVEASDGTPATYNWTTNINAADITDVQYVLSNLTIEPTEFIYGTTYGIANVNSYAHNVAQYDSERQLLEINEADLMNNFLLFCAIGEGKFPEDYSDEETADLQDWFFNFLTGLYQNGGTNPENSDPSKMFWVCKVLENILGSGTEGNTENIINAYDYFSQFIGNDDSDVLATFSVNDLIAASNTMGFSAAPALGYGFEFTSGSFFNQPVTYTPGDINDYSDVQFIDFSEYSREDIIAILFTKANNYSSFGITLDEFMNPANNNGVEYFNNLSNVELASLACMAAQNVDIEFWTLFNGLKLNAPGCEVQIPEEWENLTNDDVYFDDTNHVLTKTLDYAGNRESILNQLAYNMYEKQKASGVTTTPEDMLALLESMSLTNRQLVSFASHFNNGTTDWDTILTSLINNDSIGINHFGNGIPSNVNINFTESNVLKWDATDGTEPTEFIPGEYLVPLVDTIVSNVLAALCKNGAAVEDENAYNQLRTKITDKISGMDLADLAEINKIVCDFLNSSQTTNSKVTDLYNYITGTGTFNISDSERYYGVGRYEFTPWNSGMTCEVLYGERQDGEEPTGRMIWDTDDPAYKEYSQKYYVLKSMEGSKFKIIEDEELLNSTEFVSNWLTLNEGYLLEFDPKTQEMVDTNVAVNTNLQEIEDEKDLKKAEAKYEADMKRIDMKDRRYDTQLAALDNERNAVKQEMETVKTVAKDNVDRTFRLFS